MLASEWARARDLVARGAIGKVAFARVQSSHAGAAGLAWPVDPSPFYQEGVGALLDMAVYGITQATGVLGPARGSRPCRASRFPRGARAAARSTG